MAKRSALSTADAPASTSRTLIERAYEQLRDDIVDGHLAPDEKLRVEHLKARYGVSAGTLREAITRLVSDALVITEGQRGFRVAPIAVADLQDLTNLRVHIEIDAPCASGASVRPVMNSRLKPGPASAAMIRPRVQPMPPRSRQPQRHNSGSINNAPGAKRSSVMSVALSPDWTPSRASTE